MGTGWDSAAVVIYLSCVCVVGVLSFTGLRKDILLVSETQTDRY